MTKQREAEMSSILPTTKSTYSVWYAYQPHWASQSPGVRRTPYLVNKPMSKYNEARQDKQRRSRPWEPIVREKEGMTVATGQGPVQWGSQAPGSLDQLHQDRERDQQGDHWLNTMVWSLEFFLMIWSRIPYWDTISSCRSQKLKTQPSIFI